MHLLVRRSQAVGLRGFDAGAGEFDTRLKWWGGHVESGGSRVGFVLCLIVLVPESQIPQCSVKY